MTDNWIPKDDSFQKIIHRAKLVSPDGRVSPLCAKKPHAINLKRATWTINDSAVTCQKCQKILRNRVSASGFNNLKVQK